MTRSNCLSLQLLLLSATSSKLACTVNIKGVGSAPNTARRHIPASNEIQDHAHYYYYCVKSAQ